MRLKSIVLVLALSVLSAAGLLFAAEARTFTGRITDTMCGDRHGMVKGQPDDACVRMCVKGTSSEYALFDGKTVLRLSDQKTAARFAGRQVKVTGTYNEKTRTVKVLSMEAGS